MQDFGGTDLYTNAVSDIYYDNFDEGIFTGKGIYDVENFHKVLCEEIPENTVMTDAEVIGAQITNTPKITVTTEKIIKIHQLL